MEEYGEKFYQLIAQVDLKETEEQLIARFISYICYTLSQAYNRAILLEKQLARKP